MQAADNLTAESITQLLNRQAGGSLITMYIPTHRSASPPHMTEDQIRTKNAFHKAIEMLKQKGDRTTAAYLQEFLDGLLEDNVAFWEHRSEGLLICAENGSVQMFNLPVDTEEYVAVNSAFHLAPIFGLLHDAQQYHVLLLGQHQPRLLTGDMYGLRESGLKLPASVEQALNIDENNQKSEQQRSAEGSNGNGASYNGRGGARNPAEADRERFWRYLDQKLHTHMDAKTPLMLAGVESDVAEYRAICKHPRVLNQAILGNWANAKPHELFDKAHGIMQAELMNMDHQKAIEKYERLHGEAPEKAANKMEAIEDAATAGRVDTLLIGSIRNTADTVRDGEAEVPVLSFFENEETNRRLHETALAVWQTSGTVINLEQSDMPAGKTPMVAALRY